MIKKAKFVKALFRFKSPKGTGVMTKMIVRGKEINVPAYEQTFPCGLLKFRDLLNGESLDITTKERASIKNNERYELLNWSNQNDVIKSKIMSILLNEIANSSLQEIAWEGKVIDCDPSIIAKKALLEKIYRKNSSNKSVKENEGETIND